MKYIFLLSFFFILSSCSTPKNDIIPNIKFGKNSTLTEAELESWYLLDIVEDTIPGISLEKALDFVKNKKQVKIPIAVLDATIDVEHEDLIGSFWVNSKETKNNVDDNENGFIDDVNGWNYVGGIDNSLPLYQNYEVVRVVRFYDEYFSTNDSLNSQNSKKYQEYLMAKKKLQEKRIWLKEVIEQGKPLIDSYYNGLASIKEYLKDNEISILVLDKIAKEHENLKNEIDAVKLPLLYDMNISDLEQDLKFRERLINIYYNTEFDERNKIGDNVDDLESINYGNNLINGLKDTISHGTNVTGVIAANQKNNLGIKGIVNNISIIPVIVAVSGEAHDKDLALGIKYAVDNGAKVINISISKEFSSHKEWVFEAIKYADLNDVLIITAAGNENINLDEAKNFYPNDTDYSIQEISNNFIMVGGISYGIGEDLKYSSSNYGVETVDIMAPATDIYTTASNNTYELVAGTSFAAPIVTGIAGLIRSYFPNLTASEVKSILMDSGIAYNGFINISNEVDDEKLVPFSSLSKSGKIVNAYNALIKADSISKLK